MFYSTLYLDGVIQNADPTGNNTYCNWTWNGCVKPTDIVSCADPKVWGTVNSHRMKELQHKTQYFFLCRALMMVHMKLLVNY